ncbi:MAG: nuclear transport factor 2 family protein [Acidobacteria bacterium]|nr:nuclear transport factor 2 family protein [Acidobacteriota bacterium]
MTRNKTTVEAFMDGFRRTDRAQILSCVTDDVQWELPGAFKARGRDEFNQHIVSEGFVSNPRIAVTRLTEEDDVVVAEGSVQTEQTDGTVLHLVFCDVFVMRDGKIRQLTSYLVPTN